jgi:methylated-DNA-protein-cysteine methyltransferase related protein
VVGVVASIPPGQVLTYGEVAMEAGRPGAARAVGRAVAASDPDASLPWWRVVTASGRLVPGHETEHARLLEAEGVTVRGGRVVIGTFRGDGQPEPAPISGVVPERSRGRT